MLCFFNTIQLKAQVKNSYQVPSPNKKTYLNIGVDQQDNLVYRVLYNGNEVVTWSALGFEVNGIRVGEKTTIKSKSQENHDETFTWSLGENDRIRNNYQEAEIACESNKVKFNVITRVYDGSVAFRYELPAQTGLENALIKQENTSFNFTSPYTIYQYHHETVFTPTSLDTLKTYCDFPATLSNGKLYLSIGEAANDNFTKAELKKGDKSNSLAVVFARDNEVRVSAPFQSPWRTISVSTSAIGLHQFSELNLKLNPPAPSGVPNWIVPGKLIRAQLNTQSGLDCIDFAAKHNFKYIMFDAGWYGPERALTSDPRVVIPAINMPQVIQHGKEKGIGVILYVNYVGLQNHLDEILPLYKKWGISGMKFGFIDGFSQKGITWLAGAIKKVNDAGLLLNIHDNYKPTGLSRTYPALLTQEGIRGDENSPDAFHTTTLPFTRYLAGAADFTYVFPNPKNSFSKNLKVSKAQQLALSVVYFSPLQAIFWYGQPNDYTNEDEIEFFNYVPTVWNESRYLAGEIGKNISVARRKDQTWYVGSAAGFQDWTTEIKLDFLDKGKKYKATIYDDDEKGSVRKRTLEVKKGDQFGIHLKAKGGQALMIEPI